MGATGEVTAVTSGPKIQDVARLAKVSTSTVSNVMNGRQDRMRPETLSRVRGAIEQLGYTPSSPARQLRTGRSRAIGLIVPSVANPFWGSVARHVENVARTYGYLVLLCNAERNPLRERQYAESLWANGVKGVIFGSSPISFNHVSGLINGGLMVLEFDRTVQSTDQVLLNSVGVDNVEGMRLATQHLIELGHRRIGFLSGPIRTVSRMDRLSGYKIALQSAGIEVDPELIWQGSSISAFGDVEGAELGRSGARVLLALANPPTAMIGINDMYALGAYAGANDCGYPVPEGVSVAGFDDIPIAEVAQPPLTTVRQPLDAMAHAAVTLLVGLLEDTQAEPVEHVLIKPSLVLRSSTAAPAALASGQGRGSAPSVVSPG